jgi:hypothetical protein
MTTEQITKIKEALGTLPEQKIDNIIGELTKLTDNNIDPQEIFPACIIDPDAAEVNITVPNELFDSIKDFLENNPNKPSITDLDYFPLGIIRNDMNRIKFKVGG